MAYKSIIDEILTTESWIDYTTNRTQDTSVWRSFFPDATSDDFIINVLQDTEGSEYPELAHIHSRDAMPEQDHGLDFSTSYYKMANVQKEHTVGIYELEKLRKNYAGDPLAQKIKELCFNQHGERLIAGVNARIDLWIARMLQDGIVETSENHQHTKVDYKFIEDSKMSWDWSDASKADPITDILAMQEQIEDVSDVLVDACIVSPEILRQMAKSVKLRKNLLGVDFEIPLSVRKLQQLLADEYGLSVYVSREKFIDYDEVNDEGNTKQVVEKKISRFLDSDKMIFLPKDLSLGHTVFGPNSLDTNYSTADGLTVRNSGKIGLSSFWSPEKRKQFIRAESNFIVTCPRPELIGVSTVKTSKD